MRSEFDDSLAALGNKQRIAIIHELQRAYRDGHTGLSYAALKRGVGIRDSGNFNYHLQKLIGQFVSHSEEEYGLTYAGRKVGSALSAGIFTEQAGGQQFPSPGTCYECGEASLLARYERERLYITCEKCSEDIFHGPFPPTPVTQRDDPLSAFELWSRQWNKLIASGVCPECGSTVNIVLTDNSPGISIGDVEYRFHYECTNCWVHVYLPAGCVVRDHPAVIGAHANNGIDLDEQPTWNHHWALSQEYSTFDSERHSVQLQIPVVDEVLEVIVDSNGAIGSITT